ncbi:hypothetical protein [Haloarcula salina]|uniref:DUF8060 domain-containing protein n=1 Tax=Haloarcula salina TaxID=1429914 RepID=A0AA41GAF5_9EURY|nr:hypothetical protein [Haloarcula salina]MBV0903127.1 hypothetical protein [Haloarcula salina]
MSDTESSDPAGQHAERAAAEDATDESEGGRSIAVFAQWAAFAILVLVALIATLQFYFSASAAIDTFVTSRYRPLFNAAFNLVVLLGCGIGLSVLVRRLV